jgi:hypothetical protein
MFEDMEDTPDGEMRRFSAPIVDRETMQTIVDLIQRKRNTHDLTDIGEIRRVLLAMDYLGCTARWRKLVDRMWSLIRSSPSEVSKQHLFENASLIMPEHPTAFIYKVKLSCPGWHEFRQVFDHVVMTPAVATTLVVSLMTYFPMPLLVREILMNTPRPHIPKTWTSIFQIPRIGTYFHPDELLITFDMIARCAPSEIDTSMVRAVLDSRTGVNYPIPKVRVRASLVTFVTKNLASFFVRIVHPIRRATQITFPQNTGSLTVDTNGIEALFRMHRLGDTGSAAESAYIRLTTFPTGEGGDDEEVDFDAVRDEWTVHRVIDHENDGELALSLGADVDRLRAARIDVYWLHDPRSIC